MEEWDDLKNTPRSLRIPRFSTSEVLSEKNLHLKSLHPIGLLLQSSHKVDAGPWFENALMWKAPWAPGVYGVIWSDSHHTPVGAVRNCILYFLVLKMEPVHFQIWNLKRW